MISGDFILEVADLSVSFDVPEGRVFAVNGAELEIEPGEVLGIVGESGSGKTATAKAIMGILPSPPGHITSGTIRFEGVELTELDKSARREMMGRGLAWVPQDPLSALDPSFRVGYQVAEVIRAHSHASRSDARKVAIDLFEEVGLPDPRARARFYPHELSGGMRQRVLIAMAIALRPVLLIADEPTSALDVTVQAEILDLLKRIQSNNRMALILISHDCALVSAVADRIAVMYAGRIVETGPAPHVLKHPAHPYTRGLLQSIPSLATGSTLEPISGRPPQLRALPTGCAYAPRCPLKVDQCEVDVPPMDRVGEDRRSACFRRDVVLEQPSLLTNIQ